MFRDGGAMGTPAGADDSDSTAAGATRPRTALTFTAPDDLDITTFDAAFLAAEHGQGAVAAKALVDAGFDGYLVDLSADFRLPDPAHYQKRYERTHPAPELSGTFRYGMADLASPYPDGTKRIANPGCFATGLTLALAPLARGLGGVRSAVTALTGASGSGARPSAGTHYPDRDGNVKAYKVFRHQHLDEVLQVLGSGSSVDFVPVSGPWTRGIWGTAQVSLPEGVFATDVPKWFAGAYGNRPLVRLWPGQLPELRWSVGTPYCDLGWILEDRSLVVGFGLDNLLKGAATQAIHNLNLIAGLPETAGLLPQTQD
jgi:N-acetyl-gamma-glutamyl-phosphate reductase